MRYAGAGIAGQFVRSAAGSRVQDPGLLETAGHCTQPMSNCRSPIALGGKALRNGAMLVSAELRGIE